ncbi:MAG: fructosamine kinase family protein [Lachnospiraceae bacterium]|nr:fructosamine kinase family protein [Lachnospiraceae bacterium]
MMKKTEYAELVFRYFGADVEIDGIRSVSGGDINEARLITLSDGRSVFLKENTRSNCGSFEAEKRGLAAIKQTDTVRVPEVIGAGVAGDSSYLMMEYLRAAAPKRDYWERFGRGLAGMHMAETSNWTPGGRYGFAEDNYIGSGKQRNDVKEDWVPFFREYRLRPLFQKVSHYFNASERKAAQSLLDHLDEYLTEPAFPSLLHGDLWGGNFVTGPDGQAWLIDPAVYVGHAEADLAMTELFGGFAPAFYDAYREVNPIMPGYADRRDLYNLYHLLNHLNLFGRSYFGSVMQIVRRFSR